MEEGGRLYSLKDKTVFSLRNLLYISIPIVALIFILDLPLLIARISLYNQQFLGLFWGLVTALIFLTKPINSKQKDIQWYDVNLALAAVLVGLYVMYFYPQIISTLGTTSQFRIILGIIAVILVLESTRRMTGWSIVIIVLIFILYSHYGYLLSGDLYIKGVSWPRLFTQLYLGADFLFGAPLRTAALVVFSFIFFAQWLFISGGGDFISNIAFSLMGRFRGGPAKAAIVASALFGTISGSAVANVASTGTVTIPIMKKNGYSPTFAGATESVASTGGLIMPPVMGAAAFIMAEFLAVPYSKIILAALIPAILYFVGVFVQVDLRAIKMGVKGLPEKEIPSLRRTLSESWIFIVPIMVLLFSLFFLYQRAEVAALSASVTVIGIVLLKKNTRAKVNRTMFFEVLKETSNSMMQLTALTAAAGLIVGLISFTGLGLALSQTLIGLSGENIYILMLLTAAISIILGMGLPSVPCYILLAVLAAPALISLGVPPIAAHLFIFYFGTLSFITPPVCLAVYAGASIAGSPPMSTAVQAVKLAFAGYTVPFIFLLNPALIFEGSIAEIVMAVIMALIAIFLVSVGIEGVLLRTLSAFYRGLFIISGFAIFVPELYSTILGIVLALFALFFSLRKNFQPDSNVSINPSGTE